MFNFKYSTAGNWRTGVIVTMLCGLILPASAETLHYSINWPSGLSLGEATLQSQELHGQSGIISFISRNVSLTLDAAVPGLNLRDEYRSSSDDKFCSNELDKTVTRGSKKTTEKITFDKQNQLVTRETDAGGKSSYEAPACIHDALSFLQFVRQELAQGRLPPSQAVVLGAKYDVQLTYTGTESIARGDKRVDADRVHVTAKGPKSDFAVDLYFARDEVRTPLLAKLPLAMGTFAIELEGKSMAADVVLP